MTILSIHQIAKNLSVSIDEPVAQWAFKSQFLKGKYISIGANHDFYLTVEALKEFNSLITLDEWELQGLEEESEEEIRAKKARRKEIIAGKITLDEAYQICLKEYQNTLVEKKFIKPIIIAKKALFIEASFRPVRNPQNEEFGLYHGFTDSHYQPFWDIFNDQDVYLSLDEVNKKVSQLGFFEVKSDFDEYSVDDLKEIKHLISQEWIDAYNNL